jgi:hypothetical protein
MNSAESLGPRSVSVGEWLVSEVLDQAGEPGMEEEAVDANLTVMLRSLPERCF